MATVSAVWAYDVVREAAAAQRRHLLPTSRSCLATYGQRSARCSGLQARHANVLLAHDGSRALLLARRQGGVVGVELLAGRPMPRVRLARSASRTQGLMQYLARRRTRVMGGAADLPACDLLPRRPRPLLIHANHLLGWCVEREPAAALYACTLPQLLRLRPRQLATLRPGESVLSYRYVEWDNWREVGREPGWRAGTVAEATARALLRGELAVSAIEAWLE